MQSQCINPVRPQLEIKKILALVLYRFAHGVSPNPHISDCLQVGGSIVRKYVDIVYDVLISRDKLFSEYINIPIGSWLEGIIGDFHEIIGLPNICGIINAPIFLLQIIQIGEPHLHMVTSLTARNSILLCCNLFVMQISCSRMFVSDNLEVYTMVASSNFPACIRICRSVLFYKNKLCKLEVYSALLIW